MTPLTDGYYLSEQIQREEMHAGVRMRDSFYRYLKFYPDGYWLWSDQNSNIFDFSSFVRQFDLNYWRANHRTEFRPTSRSRDGGYLFNFGTYETKGDVTVVTVHYPAAGIERSFNLTVEDDGTRLTGWRHVFRYLRMARIEIDT